MYTKADIRKKIELLRNELTENNKSLMDEIIYQKVINNAKYVASKNIFIYVSYKNEVDTRAIIKHALDCGKTVAVPVILQGKREIEAVKITGFDCMKKNKQGILEPKLEQNNIIDGSKFDLIFIPGTGFDNKLGRVGYGAGMYDKYFSHKDITGHKLALAYDFQVLSEVPMEEFDLRVDEIITN